MHLNTLELSGGVCKHFNFITADLTLPCLPANHFALARKYLPLRASPGTMDASPGAPRTLTPAGWASSCLRECSPQAVLLLPSGKTHHQLCSFHLVFSVLFWDRFLLWNQFASNRNLGHMVFPGSQQVLKRRRAFPKKTLTHYFPCLIGQNTEIYPFSNSSALGTSLLGLESLVNWDLFLKPMGSVFSESHVQHEGGEETRTKFWSVRKQKETQENRVDLLWSPPWGTHGDLAFWPGEAKANVLNHFWF